MAMSTPLARRCALILTLALLAGGVLLFLLPTRATQVVARGGPGADSPRRADPPPALDALDALNGPDLPSSRATGARETAEGDGGPTTPGAGSIRGVVLGPTGQPCAGALCSLGPGLAPLGLDSVLADPPELVPAPNAQASTRSDSRGQFELPAPAGHWRLSVVAPEARRYEEDHLAAGAFRWIRLEPVLELTVRVFDETEAPLAGARVELLQDAYAPSLRAISFATTEPDGSARLAPPAGRWTLAVRHPDRRPHFEPLGLATGDAHVERSVVLTTGIRVHGRVSIGGSAAPPLGTRVVLDSLLMFQESRTIACEADGSFDSGHVFSNEQVLEVAALVPGFGELRKELDLAGKPAGYEVEVELPVERPERVVRGRVVDPGGAPVRNASVFLKPLLALAAGTETPLPEEAARLAEMDVGGPPAESYQAQWRWSTRTSEGGEFRVNGLDYRRPYSLLLVSPVRANARCWIDAANAPGELDLGTIVLPAGGGLHGVVRARDGSSVAGLPVSTIRLERVALRAGTTFKSQRPSALTTGFQTSTNLDGEFALRPLPAGEYYLVVAGEQFGPFAVLEGEERGPEVLELGATAGTMRLSGRTVDDRGQPIDGCFVQLFHAPERGRLTLLSATSAGSEGDFFLAAPPEGPFLFRAFDIAGEFQAHELRFEDAQRWPGGDLALLPQPKAGSPIEGRVLGPTWTGLANLRVTLHVSPAVTGCTCVNPTTITAADGSFSFGPIVPGTHRLVVLDPEGRFSPQEKFPVQPGDPLELVLEE